ncbi:MAG: NAD-dependent epimerase/dehydratase family protein [Opitutae bacterium]|nr:NAD-dependent epimerase/dehydratase family protein [Opitutae bacterium]
MATYLVTGAAGFIASKVCEYLLAEGHAVVGVDNLNDYYDVRLKDWRLSRLLGASSLKLGADPRKSVYAGNSKSITHGWFSFQHLDIENLPALDALFCGQKYDAVFNLAARAGVRYSMENPYVYLSTNTLGTLNLLECQRKYGVKKQVLASTSSLYAGCPLPFTEELPVNTPLSPYAATKKAAEMMAYSYHKLYGLDISVVRFFTVFGPAGRPDMSIFRFIKWIDEGKPLELFGDGTQSRDFTYIDDIARGTVLAAKPLGYEIINLGGGRNPINLQTVITFIEKALGKKAIISGQPFHIADIKETWADIAKADRLLGWKPTVSNIEGFQRSVDWYREHRSWLADIHL